MGQRGDVAFTGEQEPQGVLARSPLRPLEVDVGGHVVLLADRQQDSGQDVGDAGAGRPEHPVVADPGGGDLHLGGEVAGVADLDLQEHGRLADVEVVVETHVERLLVVLLVVSGLDLVRDEAHRRVLHQDLVEQLLGGLVEGDLLDPQLGGAADAGDKRDDDDHRDEDQRDEQALGAVEDGHGDRVDEHGRDDSEESGRAMVAAPPLGQGDRDRRRGHQGQDTGGVGPGLGVHVGLERDGDDHGDER